MVASSVSVILRLVSKGMSNPVVGILVGGTSVVGAEGGEVQETAEEGLDNLPKENPCCPFPTTTWLVTRMEKIM